MRPIRLPGSALMLLTICAINPPSWAVAAEPNEALFDLSLDQLMKIRVTSVSRQSEELRDAPSAIYVITGDDIRRSGATSIPDALRVVPGLNVRRAGSANWSISARGFDRPYSNKLLVMIDGRTVYSPSFSGVYWDAQDTLLEDVARIEVIRGPGAVMWGANAVNGVINIITLPAQKTQNGLASITAGTQDRLIASVRYGDRADNGGAWRTWVKATDRDNQQTLQPNRGDDSWQSVRSGFRFDSAEQERNRFTVQGDIYANRKGLNADVPTVSAPFQDIYDTDENIGYGGNLMGRWQHTSATGGEISTQLYYDNEQRRADEYFKDILHTTDIEVQHVPAWQGRHSWIWGGGARYVADELEPGLVFPEGEDSYYRRSTAFFQYGYALIENVLDISVGSKFEYNDFSHFEAQPSIRLMWEPQQHRALWTAVSRAVRTPGRIDQNATVPLNAAPGAPPVLINYRGNPDYQSEVLTAYEWGWRERWSENVSSDLAVFYNDYDDERATLLTDVTFVPGPPTYIDQSLQPFNANEVRTWGFEYLLDWQPARSMQLQAWYSFLRRVDDISDNPAVLGVTPGARLQEDRDAASVRAYWVKDKYEIDSHLRYVDAVKTEGIDAYTEFNLRFGWRIDKHWRVSLLLANLLEDAHQEGSSRDSITLADTEVERSAALSLEWRAAPY